MAAAEAPPDKGRLVELVMKGNDAEGLDNLAVVDDSARETVGARAGTASAAAGLKG